MVQGCIINPAEPTRPEGNPTVDADRPADGLAETDGHASDDAVVEDTAPPPPVELAWTKTILPTKYGAFSMVRASGPNDVWISLQNDASDGLLFHWDGAKLSAPQTLPKQRARGLVVFSPGDAMLMSEFPITPWRWNGTTWTQNERLVGFKFYYLGALFGRAPDDVWVGADNEPYFWHFDGARWTQIPATGAGENRGIWAASKSDVWAIGTGGIFHYDGARWSVFDASIKAQGSTRAAMWGSSANDIWATSIDGTFHYDGKSWSKRAESTILGRCVHGTGPNDVWVGVNHWNGETWTPTSGEKDQPLSAEDVFALSPTNVYVVSSNELWHLAPK